MERVHILSGAGWREVADRVPDGAEEEGWPRVPFDEERGELLHRHPPEAGAKGAAAHAAEEIAPTHRRRWTTKGVQRTK